MHQVETAPSNMRSPSLTFEDERLASNSPARLLITAMTSADAEACARRIHALGLQERFRFVQTEASDLPLDGELRRETCSHLLDEAAGGTLFVNDVDAMPACAQERFVELLVDLQLTREVSTAVRLVSGTTVSLLDRVSAGTFAERLFYRLNTIHFIHTDFAPTESKGGVAL